MIYNGNTTMYSRILANRMLMGLPYEPLPNTTLNEKFDIIPRYQEYVDIGYPKLNLLTIGGFEKQYSEIEHKIELSNGKHTPLHAALFNHIPFYLRRITETENFPVPNKLRLKKYITINEIEYVAYYGYILDEFDTDNDIMLFNNIDTDYVDVKKLDINSGNFLNPVFDITSIREYENITFTTDFIKIPLFLSNLEVSEIANAFRIINNLNSNDGFITEMGLAVSHEITLGDGSKECVRSQMNYFVETDISLPECLENEKLSLQIELGGMEVVRTGLLN